MWKILYLGDKCAGGHRTDFGTRKRWPDGNPESGRHHLPHGPGPARRSVTSKWGSLPGPLTKASSSALPAAEPIS
jgi:hypothetical protein